MGGKAKFSEEVVQAFRITGKIYIGQLTEEARIVQIEELALQHGGRKNLKETL